MYEELKAWQGAIGSGIGSVVGFGALISGALYNFHLNRRRDAELRKQEALSVAVALYGEILLLRREAARLARAAAFMARRNQEIDERFLEIHALPEPILYTALASKIGLLSPDLIIAITEFHKNYYDAKTSLPLLKKDNDRGYSYDWSDVLIPARDAVRDVILALKKIQRMASIPESIEELQLGETEGIIEYEALKYENE